MAKSKKNVSPLKEFDAGYLLNPYLCKTHLRARGIENKEMLVLTFAGINMGAHVGWKKK